MSSTDLKYFAGFFDAEGCVSVHYHKMASGLIRHQLRATVACTNEVPLLIFKQVFGGTIGRYKQKSEKHKLCFYWDKSIRKDDPIFSLLPYVIIKDDVLRLAREFSESLKSTGGRNKKNKSPADIERCMVTARDVELREAICSKIRNSNQSGHVESGRGKAVYNEYLAGLFDGDGCVAIRKQSHGRTFYPTAQIYSSNVTVLEIVKVQFGGSVHGNYRGGKCAHWVGACQRAKSFLLAIRPFLLMKKAACDKALELCALNHSPRTIKMRGLNNGLQLKSQEVINAMLAVKADVAVLNRMGA